MQMYGSKPDFGDLVWCPHFAFVGSEGRIKPGQHEDPIATPTGSTILKIRH